MLIACLFANIGVALQNYQEVGRARWAMLERRRSEMNDAHVPVDLRQKVEATYKHLWKFGGQNNGMLVDPVLSMDLRRNLAVCVYGAALRRVPIFQFIDDRYLKCLAQKVELRLYTPGDLLVMQGELGTELFIIQVGAVQAQQSSGELVGEVMHEGSL